MHPCLAILFFGVDEIMARIQPVCENLTYIRVPSPLQFSVPTADAMLNLPRRFEIDEFLMKYRN